jgi:hypothetical protein
VLTLKEMSYLIHALTVASDSDATWWTTGEKIKRGILRDIQDLIEIQFFLQEATVDTLHYPHDDPSVISSLIVLCDVLQQWLDTQVSDHYHLHTVIPMDEEGTMVIVFTN